VSVPELSLLSKQILIILFTKPARLCVTLELYNSKKLQTKQREYASKQY